MPLLHNKGLLEVVHNKASNEWKSDWKRSSNPFQVAICKEALPNVAVKVEF